MALLTPRRWKYARFLSARSTPDPIVTPLKAEQIDCENLFFLRLVIVSSLTRKGSEWIYGAGVWSHDPPLGVFCVCYSVVLSFAGRARMLTVLRNVLSLGGFLHRSTRSDPCLCSVPNPKLGPVVLWQGQVSSCLAVFTVLSRSLR